MLSESDRYIYAARLLRFVGAIPGAVQLLSLGLDAWPGDVRLLRHRGHGRISVRDFEGAVADLSRARDLMEAWGDEHEFYQADTVRDLVQIVLDQEDLVTNQRIPVDEATIAKYQGRYKSTLHASVWYHLGLARYLLGDFQGAELDFAEASAAARDDDIAVGALDWRYMCLRRLGRHSEASEVLAGFQPADVKVSSTEDFYLRRVKMYRGELSPDSLLESNAGSVLAVATQGYGVGNWYLCNGDRDRAGQVFKRVLAEGNPMAFGYIAAEVDLGRLEGAR